MLLIFLGAAVIVALLLFWPVPGPTQRTTGIITARDCEIVDEDTAEWLTKYRLCVLGRPLVIWARRSSPVPRGAYA